ncbi:MAG: hypothetical protein R6U27_09605 [Desulfobacterales bacterium]
MPKYLSDNREPIILLLNGLDHEGVLNSLRSIGKDYKLKYLHSSVDNWMKILNLFKKYDIIAVIGKITSTTCLYFVQENYKQVTKNLFEEISKKPHLFFMFEGLMARQERTESQDEFSEPYQTDLPPKEVLDTANELIESHNLNVLPSITSAEETISARNFIKNVEKNIFFRIYFPVGHIWNNEIDRVISLFREYISKLSKVTVRVDQKRTPIGVIYTFCSNGRPQTEVFASAFNDFTYLLDICVKKTSEAESILKSKGFDAKDIEEIINRYSIEACRIRNDLQYSNSLNVSLQFVKKVQNVIHSLSGNINYSEEEKEILQLIDRYGQKEYAELISSLNELKDYCIPITDRIMAKQKLKKFLLKCSHDPGNMTFSLLKKYLELQCAKG